MNKSSLQRTPSWFQLLEKLKLQRQPTPEPSSGNSPPLWNSFFVEGGAPVDAMQEASRINKQGRS
jgi:hypothetical protein